MTGKQLAEAVGVDEDTIVDWEKLESPGPRFQYRYLDALATALKRPIDYIVKGEEEYAAALNREFSAGVKDLRRELADLERRLEERLRQAGI